MINELNLNMLLIKRHNSIVMHSNFKINNNFFEGPKKIILGTCPECDQEIIQCWNCKGSGTEVYSLGPQMLSSKKCGPCLGKGQICECNHDKR